MLLFPCKPFVALGGCATGNADDIARIDGRPDAADASVGDVASTDTAVADATSPPDTTPAPADATAPDATTPLDGSSADTTAADSSTLDTTAVDTSVVDSKVADTTVADSAVADTMVADTAVADTAVADMGPVDSGTDLGAETPVATCPTALSLGTFTAGADGWAFDGLWRHDGGSASMVAGSSTKYSSSYTQNLTNPANVDLSGCTTATLGFSVRLADEPDYSSKAPDKSERLYVQCSGDGGTTWANLTPSAWPTNQSACATSYCCGGPGTGRSFPLTAQTTTLPAACRAATTRFRFQAKGTSVWNLQNSGWYVDTVKLN